MVARRMQPLQQFADHPFLASGLVVLHVDHGQLSKRCMNSIDLYYIDDALRTPFHDIY